MDGERKGERDCNKVRNSKKERFWKKTAKLKQEVIREKREGEEENRKEGERERKEKIGREPLL